MVFYHIYVASIWEEIVAEQATRLIFSGVYSEAAAINVGIGAKEQQVCEGVWTHATSGGVGPAVVFGNRALVSGHFPEHTQRRQCMREVSRGSMARGSHLTPRSRSLPFLVRE